MILAELAEVTRICLIEWLRCGGNYQFRWLGGERKLVSIFCSWLRRIREEWGLLLFTRLRTVTLILPA